MNPYPLITFDDAGTPKLGFTGITVEQAMIALVAAMRAGAKHPRIRAARELKINDEMIEAAEAFARDSWCTPLELAQLLPPRHRLMDPCSNPRSHVDAAVRFMLEHGQNGLELPWSWPAGQFIDIDTPLVFVNGGFSDLLPWVEKLERERAAIAGACFLVNHDHSTRWYQRLAEIVPCQLQLDRRQKFIPYPGVPQSSNNKPQTLLGDRAFFEECDPRIFELGEMYEKASPRAWRAA